MARLWTLRIATRLFVLVGVFLAGFGVFALFALRTIAEVQVEGPKYARIAQSKDLVADVLPPPQYVVESYLGALEMLADLEAGADRAGLTRQLAHARELRARYEERHAFWRRALPEGQLREALVTSSYAPAMAFYAALGDQFIPAVLARDVALARTLVETSLRPSYEAHRAAIDRVVAMATAQMRRDEAAAVGSLARTTRFLLAIGLATAALATLAGLLIARSITVPLSRIAEVARGVAEGRLDARPLAAIVSRDETGLLARTFMSMMERLEHTLRGLEATNTELQHSTTALDESRARFADIIGSAMDAIITMDERHRVVIFNAAAEKMFGLAAKDALGQLINRFIPARFHGRHDQHVERFGRAGITTRAMGALGEVTASRESGEEFPAEASISRIHSGGLFTVILRDVTERRRAEDHVRRLNADLAEANASLTSEIAERRQAEEARAKLESQLRHVQKIESVGLLAGGVAHDFNNLLTPILANADLLMSDLPPGDPRQSLIAEIGQAAERARLVTHQLLAFGRKQMLDLKDIDLADAVRRFEHMLRRTIREDIRIEVVARSASSPVRADVGQIEQVLLNLAINARDAMSAGGALTIEVQDVVLDDEYAREHSEVKAGSYVMLAVSDTGTGIDPSAREHLFEPFFTTKDRDKGTGLGLSTVHGIVKQHGGSISVYSEPGRGTTFKVYLPRLAKATEADAARRAPPPEARRARDGETVLVVEDNEMVRNVASTMLRRLGYHVLAADGFESCLSVAAAHAGEIHLLLTDVILSNSNGKETFDRLSAVRPKLKVLYMSGYTSDIIVHRGVIDEGVHFIAKPLSLESLSLKLREVLDD